MPDGWLTVATFDTPIAAELARVRLDGAEIPVFLADSHTVSLNPFYGGAIGVRLQVPTEFADEATEILRSEQFPVFIDPGYEEEITETDNPYSAGVGSNDDEGDTDTDDAENSVSVYTSRSGFQFDKKRFTIQIGVFIVVIYVLIKLLFR